MELLALAYEVYEYASTAIQIYDTVKDVANYISDKVDHLFNRTSIDRGYHYEPQHVFVCFKFSPLLSQKLALMVFTAALTVDLSDSNQFTSLLLTLRTLIASARPMAINRFPPDQPYLMVSHPSFIRLYIPFLSAVYAREQESFLTKLQDLLRILSVDSSPIVPLYTISTFESKYELRWTNRDSLQNSERGLRRRRHSL